MHLQCPNCLAAIEVLEDETAGPYITCSICGSRLSASGDETQTFVAEPRGRIDEYELIELLGQGTFGEVWKARDTGLKSFVAIKRPRNENFAPRAKELFLREAQIMATLTHPNIVRVLRVIDRPDLTAIVMEFVDGLSLKDRLKNRPFESPRQAAQFFETVVRAVHHAHCAGVVHRDLKPANILLNQNQQPLVTDFGLAKYDSAEFTIGGDDAVLGNFAHMPPEQAAGKSSDADCRSDIYSLGSILYELLAGRPAFVGGGRTLSVSKQQDDPRPPSAYNSAVPRDLDTICLYAMQRDPAKRYQTAEEMADDLRRHLDGHPIHARPTPTWERLWRWSQRNRPLAATACLALVVSLLLAATLILFRGNALATPQSDLMDVAMPIFVRNADAQGILEPLASRENGKPAPRANVKFWLRNPTNGTLDDDQSPSLISVGPTGLAAAKLRPGDYLVVAEIPDHGFHEVERHVPSPTEKLPGAFRQNRWEIRADGLIELPQVDVPPESVVKKGMVAFDPSPAFSAGSNDIAEAPRHIRGVNAFLLDPVEVTVDDWNRYMSELSGQPVPGSREAITKITFEQAQDYAEWSGKRLQDEFEYEVAATNDGTTAFPWGDASTVPEGYQWTFGPVQSTSFDVSKKGIHGLYSNVLEFTGSWYTLYPSLRALGLEENPLAPTHRVVRGGPGAVVSGQAEAGAWKEGPAGRFGTLKMAPSERIGLRCARSVVPKLK